jgi:hypothetical protein
LLAGRLEVFAAECIVDGVLAVRLYPLTRSEEIANAA